MTLEQLRIFLAVAEYLHFTRAAEALFITQPAVSAAIQNLEAEYGVKLFHRIGRRIEIAEAGKLLQIEAQKIIDQVVQAERGLKELNNLQRGELKLGASLTIGNYWLPGKISQFKRQYPGINIDCTLANAEEICEGTATGIFDFGLLTGEVKPTLESYLDQEVVGSERLQIVVGKSHPWFQRPEITVSELDQTDWVMREPGSGVQQMFEQALQSWGVDPSQLNVVLVLPSSDMIKAVVENDMGAAAIPDLMVTKELQLATLRSVTVMPNKGVARQPLEILQKIWKLKHRQRFQTKIASVFEDMLQL
ncbi:LysR substrate-binding domain-containing protein [[Phormidium] sp. ETS-05]|uniref:LysR substrate-binding domain-containing protein n=1 Tax=[Phormidium] sp. ETS-05 TaxID=222819 RepID=UPI0018EECECF|nr:LysR substrate-binding domain-containing protein [[Phormidium] sp. ETS-05]